MLTAALDVVIAKRWMEASDIVGLELRASDGQALPAYAAGAHIDVEIAAGLVRQYSLCGDATDRHAYTIAVLLDPQSRGGSAAVHHLLEQQRLRISEPRNHFALATGTEPTLLFAGGIGITPLLAMADRLHAIDAGFTLHYATRSSDRTAFLQRLRASDYAGKVAFHFDDGSAEQRLDLPGVLDAALRTTHLYVCGPAGFIDAVLGTARSLGWPEDHLHREYFLARAIETEGDAAFRITIASSGETLEVGADQTVLEVLNVAGIEIPVSCEQGVCGTCVTRVLQGTPDHRDVYLTDEEHAQNDQFTPCCSRARSATLVLDL